FQDMHTGLCAIVIAMSEPRKACLVYNGSDLQQRIAAGWSDLDEDTRSPSRSLRITSKGDHPPIDRHPLDLLRPVDEESTVKVLPGDRIDLAELAQPRIMPTVSKLARMASNDLSLLIGALKPFFCKQANVPVVIAFQPVAAKETP